jgi:hypothetical protein
MITLASALARRCNADSIGLHFAVVNKRIANNGTAIEGVVERVIVIECGQFAVQIGYLESRLLHIFRILTRL